MSLFDDRVDAAVKEYDRHFSARTQTVFGAGMRRTAMAEAIRAADAVVTEGRVEEALYEAFQDWDEESDGLFAVQARAVMSLFRGGAK